MRKLTTNVQVFRKINKKQLFELHISFNKVKVSQENRNWFLFHRQHFPLQ